MTSIITNKNLEVLGLVAWLKMDEMIQKGFKDQELGTMRRLSAVAQQVVSGQKISIQKATEP